ncbi:MAG: 30S ribosomal protein S6e [Thermoplasmata archaeon]|nr:30S ribosomal protein S6e [Thermoplasmata archaeon]
MVEFKASIADPETGKCYSVLLTKNKASTFIGKEIGDTVDGIFVGLPHYKITITGGTDEAGFPMRKDTDGANRKKILMTDGVGFHAKRRGQRKRRMATGRKISPNIVQLNFKISQRGAKPVEGLLKSQEVKE